MLNVGLIVVVVVVVEIKLNVGICFVVCNNGFSVVGVRHRGSNEPG